MQYLAQNLPTKVCWQVFHDSHEPSFKKMSREMGNGCHFQQDCERSGLNARDAHRLSSFRMTSSNSFSVRHKSDIMQTSLGCSHPCIPRSALLTVTLCCSDLMPVLPPFRQYSRCSLCVPRGRSIVICRASIPPANTSLIAFFASAHAVPFT